MAAILSRPQCVNIPRETPTHVDSSLRDLHTVSTRKNLPIRLPKSVIDYLSNSHKYAEYWWLAWEFMSTFNKVTNYSFYAFD